MTRRISAYQARLHLGELLNQVHYRGDEIVIEKMGKPMARLVGITPSIHPPDWRNKIRSFAGALSHAEGERFLKSIRQVRKRSHRKIRPLP